MKSILKLLVLITIFIPVNLGAESLKSTGQTECFSYDLTANRTSVYEGQEIQFEFSYESIQPACSPEQIAGLSVQVDFSHLVADGSDISASFDTETLTIDVSPEGLVTIQFKDLSDTDNTLVDFGGSVIFTVVSGDLEGEDITISDSVGNTVDITVSEGTGQENTNKVSDVEYVVVGDTINYSILINGQANEVDNFYGEDTASSGLDYVPGSFWVENQETYEHIEGLFTPSINDNGNLVVTNNDSFNQSYLLHYQMEVVSQESSYTNQFDATYDTHVDTAHDDILFDVDGNGWIDYSHGKIEVHKLNANEQSLSGAEFDLFDADGNFVEHLATDETGTALSANHQLGSYYLVETKAPTGYVIDEEPINVEITSSGKEEVTVGVDVYNTPISGQVELNKVNEVNEALAGVEFTIYDSNGDVADVLTTDESGYAISKQLLYGEYTLKETEALENYKPLDEEFTFKIEEDGQIVQVNGGEAIINYEYEKPDITDPIIDRPIEFKPITPEVPEVVEPEKPIDPQVPEVVEPEKPIDPQVPEVVEPEVPVDPEVPEVVEPEKPINPEVPEVVEPEKPIDPQVPEVVEPEKPEVPEIVEPEVPVDPEVPEVVEPEDPEVPEVVEPEVPVDPEVPEVVEPEVVEPEAKEEKTLAETAVDIKLGAVVFGFITLSGLVAIRFAVSKK